MFSTSFCGNIVITKLYQGDTMSDNKNASILLRLTQEEKNKITSKAKSVNESTNKFLKDLILNNLDNAETNSDNKNDINNDIIELLKEQLNIKDEQIHNLQTIIFNRDAKLLELSKKHWWQFWK